MKAEDVITAMKISGVNMLPEGHLYALLFKHGMTPDEATAFMRDLLATERVARAGCVLVLNKHGKENSNRAWAVCDSR